MNIKLLAGRTWLKLRKYSPEILVGAGVIGGVTAAIWAVKVTASKEYRIKAETHENELESIAEAREKYDEERYTPEEHSKDVITENVEHYRGVLKMYWKPTVLGLTSVGCVLAGFSIIRKRNAALMVAYSIVDGAFKKYRERVVDSLGKDKDQEFMHGTVTTTTTEKVKNPDGTKSVVETKEQFLCGEKVSMYAVVFDKNNSCFRDTHPGYNWLFIKKKRDYLNDRLNAFGHVFLNEAYDELGFPHTQAGSVVGWVKGNGDDYISFGPWSEDYDIVDKHPEILMDFNVDGVIWDKI